MSRSPSTETAPGALLEELEARPFPDDAGSTEPLPDPGPGAEETQKNHRQLHLERQAADQAAICRVVVLEECLLARKLLSEVRRSVKGAHPKSLLRILSESESQNPSPPALFNPMINRDLFHTVKFHIRDESSHGIPTLE